MPGEVTAESLSDPDSDHFVVSIPEDLDQAQKEVVLAYVAYDRATWRAYRAMDGDHSAAETTTGGDGLADRLVHRASTFVEAADGLGDRFGDVCAGAWGRRR